MRSSLSVVPRSLVPLHSSKFSVLIDAFATVTDIMRYHEVESFTEEIGSLYAMLTGNMFLLSRMYTCQTSPVTELRPEMAAFIDNRIKFIFDTTITRIKSHFEIADDDSIGDVFIVEQKYNEFSQLTLHDIQQLEFSIANICERVSEFKTYRDEKLNFATNKTYDMKSILRFLLIKFAQVSARLTQPTRSNINARVINRNDDDLGSTRSVIILGLMIAKVVKSMLVIREYDGSEGWDDKRKILHDLIADKYAQYSTMGSLSCAGIICCYKNTNLIPSIIINKDGRVGTVEKSLLANILILSELV